MNEEKWMTLIGMFFNLDNTQLQNDHPLVQFKSIDLYGRVLMIRRLSDKRANEILSESLCYRMN